MQKIGLDIAPSKTAVALFYSGNKLVELVGINILDHNIMSSDSLKYLGIIFDRRLNFKLHFEYMESKATKCLRSLWTLLPNLKGPSETKRRLYVNVVHSILTYGAPVWAETFGLYKSYQEPIRRIQRGMALRVISAYRTISFESALLLARIPPFHLLVAKLNRIFIRRKQLI